jgi:hypothetical protein
VIVPDSGVKSTVFSYVSLTVSFLTTVACSPVFPATEPRCRPWMTASAADGMLEPCVDAM